MGWLGWTLTIIGLGVFALAVMGLLALRLWRAAKALGRDLARASNQLAQVGSMPGRSGLS